MRAVVQRVSRASVTVEGALAGEVGRGLLVLLGVAGGDGEREVDWMAEKTAHLRIFEDAEGKMNRSVLEEKGGVLAVSQFTLMGDARKGRRPDFTAAARPEVALPLYERFCERLRALGVAPVARGVFGARMEVALVNEGPVTILLETPLAPGGGAASPAPGGPAPA
jgi:D-tyrosyl-tRNA(Tyr) deacylase